MSKGMFKFCSEKMSDPLSAKKEIGNRGGRIGPRAIKKRHNAYPLLMKNRDVARAEVLKNGHPKQ